MCMIKSLLLCMLQLRYYAVKMHGCFKMTLVNVHASCFGKHKHRLISDVNFDIAPLNPHQPLQFHILSYAHIPIQTFGLC